MMTMPHLMNCPHSDDSWCLDCVKEQHDEIERLRVIRRDELLKRLQGAEDGQDVPPWTWKLDEICTALSRMGFTVTPNV